MSQEKVFHLKALGAEVVMTRSDVGRGHPQYYQDMAERDRAADAQRILRQPVQQPRQSVGPRNHHGAGDLGADRPGPGRDRLRRRLGRHDHRPEPLLRPSRAQVEMVLADPVGSVLADFVETGRVGEAGSWVVEGIGEDFVPPIADLSRVRAAYKISDAESLLTARDLLRREGILAGSSSGTLVAAALRDCREQSRPKRVVTLACDSGNKYLSKMFNDFWMADRGLLGSASFGDLHDVISHRFSEGAVVSVGPDNPLNVAYSRMRMYDVSQVPVLDGAAIVGILDESDLLLAVMGDAAALQRPARDFMTTRLETVPPKASLPELLPIFDAGRVAIVADADGFYGLITRVDVLSHLRRQHLAA